VIGKEFAVLRRDGLDGHADALVQELQALLEYIEVGVIVLGVGRVELDELVAD
jgi:hypothetical protein